MLFRGQLAFRPLSHTHFPPKQARNTRAVKSALGWANASETKLNSPKAPRGSRASRSGPPCRMLATMMPKGAGTSEKASRFEYRGPLVKNAQGNAVNAMVARAPHSMTPRFSGNRARTSTHMDAGYATPARTAFRALTPMGTLQLVSEHVRAARPCHAAG